MSILSNSLMTGADTAFGYQIARSLRLDSADSASLSRTPGSAGNRKTWTWAGWIKRSGLGSNYLFTTGSSSSSAYIYFDNDNRLVYWDWRNGANGVVLQTNALFRDTSAWLHVVCSVDYSAATAADRAKLYVNGVAQTYYASSYPLTSEDSYVNATVTHYISSGSSYVNGYLADIHFIDGQALTPSIFGGFDSNGVWQPIEYTGSYGTNGFHLDFSDNSSATALGYDAAGSNDWTPNNLSITAGSGNDSLVDVPTNGTETDSGIGGEVRGNYATLNPLDKGSSVTLANGNLQFAVSTNQSCRATIGVSSGKWYWEVVAAPVGAGVVGISGLTDPLTGDLGDSGAQRGLRLSTGVKTGLGATSGTTATFTGGNIAGLALDLDSGELTIYKNGSSLGVTHTGITGILVPTLGMYSSTSATLIANFGQRPFAYTAPSGYKALCSTNLPAGTITTSGSFTGNAAADGPFVYLNGVPTAMTINGNAVTFGTHADKLSNGFKLRTNSTSYNTSGSNTFSVSATGDKFNVARAQPNP